MGWLKKMGLNPTKWFSRKLIVFVIATVFLYLGKMTENTWIIVAGTYIGANMIVELMKIYKGQNGS